MKIFGSFSFLTFLILLTINLTLVSVTYAKDQEFEILKNIVTPIPSNLKDNLKENTKSAYWIPSRILKTSSQKPLELSAISAISYDMTSNQLLYAKNIDEKRPIASLTKIMTAVIALENMNLSESLTVSHSAANIGEDSMGLKKGEKLNLEDLLYGLILNSGNDAAEVIAQQSPYGRENFVHLMNVKAEDLGLSDTRYTNPTGLQGDGEQYSTAKDLLIVTHYALQNPEFAKIASTFEHDIPKSSTHKAYTLYNETNLLTTYPGVEGVKTGFTDEAGMCLITYLNYKGHKIIAILMHSDDRRGEMKELLDYSLKSLGVTPPPHN
jgi:D-alanyl-D-alanine carboxypeptidase (penicillin-binding protein 5/6)